MTAETRPLAVHAAIVQVMDEVGKEGVGKNHSADFGGAKRNYRGIDDIYNALNRAMVRAKLAIIPSVAEKTVERFERENQYKKMVTTHVYSMVIDYKVICAVDSSFEIMRIFIEGFDTSDKGTGKAFSYAYKCGVLQLFCIPVEGQEDQDAHDPKIERDKAPDTRPAPAASKPSSPAPRCTLPEAGPKQYVENNPPRTLPAEAVDNDTSPIINYKGHPLNGQRASKLDDGRLVKFLHALINVKASEAYIKSIYDYAVGPRGIQDLSSKTVKRGEELAAAVGEPSADEADLHLCLWPEDIRPSDLSPDIRAWNNTERLIEYGAWLEMKHASVEHARARMLRVEACLKRVTDAEKDLAEKALRA